MTINLRSASADDMPFLLRVYAGTRAEELARTGWSDAQKAAFVEMQFAAQDGYYREHYPGALFDIILVDGQEAGRLYLHHRPEELRVMDIALLPEFRNRGVGTALLRDVIAEARGKGVAVTMHVESFNPAARLYERLGFRRVADNGVYHLLRWSEGVADAC